jgi:hypothetical protein
MNLLVFIYKLSVFFLPPMSFSDTFTCNTQAKWACNIHNNLQEIFWTFITDVNKGTHKSIRVICRIYLLFTSWLSAEYFYKDIVGRIAADSKRILIWQYLGYFSIYFFLSVMVFISCTNIRLSSVCNQKPSISRLMYSFFLLQNLTKFKLRWIVKI